VPDVVKQNSLAQIYNTLCTQPEEILAELGQYYGEGEPIYDDVAKLTKGGPIPSSGL